MPATAGYRQAETTGVVRRGGRPWQTDALDVEAMLAGRPELLRDALDRSLAYLGGVADRPVAPDRAAVDGLSELDFKLPATGLAAMDVLGAGRRRRVAGDRRE